MVWLTCCANDHFIHIRIGILPQTIPVCLKFVKILVKRFDGACNLCIMSLDCFRLIGFDGDFFTVFVATCESENEQNAH